MPVDRGATRRGGRRAGEFRTTRKVSAPGNDRHERRDERESEDLRIDEAHAFGRRKQPVAWSFTTPTACRKA